MEFIDLKSQQARIRNELDRRIAAVLDHGRYIMGPEVAELEGRLADYVGVSHCIGASSGTDTLLIALMALGIGPGDEVITVPYTWISTAEMIRLIGATPVFVDIDEKTWNMDPLLVEAAITDRTKAIMPVGIYGQTADMTAINEIAARHGKLACHRGCAPSALERHITGSVPVASRRLEAPPSFPQSPSGATAMEEHCSPTTMNWPSRCARSALTDRRGSIITRSWVSTPGSTPSRPRSRWPSLMSSMTRSENGRPWLPTYHAKLEGAGVTLPPLGSGNTSVYAQ